MKYWQNHLLPIVLLGILAAATTWLQYAGEVTLTARDGHTRHDPDAIAENFSIRRYDDKGDLRYRLVAPRLQHYPDNDTSDVDRPMLVASRPKAPPVTITSKSATVDPGRDITVLTGGVTIHRDAKAPAQPLIVTSSTMTLQPDRGFAQTAAPVEFRQGRSWLKGTGMDFDYYQSTLLLKAKVSGVRYPEPKP